jgi:ATP/maltotriose-dependent transcriptional regulator MalT
LREWALHRPLVDPERAQIFGWLDSHDEQGKRNALFWNSAKESVLGRVVYDNACKRHGILKEREWLVACFIARGLQQAEIADLLRVSRPTIDIAVRKLKEDISKDLGCDVKSLNTAVIASWFFGL